MVRLPLLLVGLYLTAPVFAAPPTEQEIEAKVGEAMEFYQGKGEPARWR